MMSTQPAYSTKEVTQADELVFGAESGALKEVINIPTLKFVSEINPILKEVMPQYDFASQQYSERKSFSEAMIYNMRMIGGVGLSACQVGYKIRMFIMDQIDVKKQERLNSLVCYNPEVIKELEPPAVAREGCLSFPGLSLQIKRSTGILASWQDEGGNFHEEELFGMDAKCFQHELDHMNGIVFTSKVKQDILNWEREKQRKLIKKASKRFKPNGRA